MSKFSDSQGTNFNSNTTMEDSICTNLSSNTMMEDDNSWNNIECNWSTFSFEDELTARKTSTKNVLQELKEIVLDVHKDSHIEDDLQKLVKKHHDAETENYGILKKSEDLKTTLKELKEKCKNLESTCEKLVGQKNSLASKISELNLDHKFRKTAYKTALQSYEKNFDFKVDIIETSNDVFAANIQFNFAKDMEPIKVVVDRNKRKIIDIDTKGLVDGEDAIFDSDFFCNLRQKIAEIIL